MSRQFSIKSILLVTTLSATAIGSGLYTYSVQRAATENRRRAKEFVSSHGNWIQTKGGDYWDLSHIKDLSIEELSTIEHLEEYSRKRIKEIDFCGSNVTDAHLGFLHSLTNLKKLDFRKTNVSRTMIEELIASSGNGMLFVEHDY